MNFTITTDSNNILRIGDNDGAFITLRTDRGEADILSITVPERSRRRGTATALLKAAEDELVKRGVNLVLADYLDSIEGIGEFLAKNGYEITDGPAVLDVKSILVPDNPTVKKLMKHRIDDAVVIRLGELSISRWDELLGFLSERGIALTCYDLARMHQQISTVVYDRTGKICSLFLASARDNKLYLELLYSRSGEDTGYYTLAVLQTITMIICASPEYKRCDQFLLALCNSGFGKLMEHMNMTEAEPLRVGRCKSACKNIGPDTIDHKSNETDQVDTAIEEGTESEWIRELSGIPMQRIISWKVPWHRDHQKHGDHIRKPDE